MARDLHDTLLQTLQGSKLVADTALDRPDDAPALARALQQVSAWQRSALDTSLTVTGGARELHPVVRDELYRIDYEAIRNACVHSGGHRRDVALDYAQDLTLRVTDDGTGMEPTIAERGKAGHSGSAGCMNAQPASAPHCR